MPNQASANCQILNLLLRRIIAVTIEGEAWINAAPARGRIILPPNQLGRCRKVGQSNDHGRRIISPMSPFENRLPSKEDIAV